MRDWAIDLYRETGRDTPGLDILDSYLDALTGHHAAVSATPQGRVSACLTVAAPGPVAAVAIAIEAESTAANEADIGGHVTAVTVVDAATPDADTIWVRMPLLGLADIGKMLGVSRQRASQLATQHPAFPPVVVRASTGTLFEEAAVRAFQDNWERNPGRPVGQPAKA